MSANTLTIPAGVLYYEIQGTGPLLLISQSGEGDAGRTADLVRHLADAWTVITYDRRGLGRSTVPATTVSVSEHADDVHRLLAHLTREPVAMLGQSLGAAIGLHLAAAHPGQLSLLIAHEPVSPWLLPEPERARHRAELAALRDLYLAAGLPAAIKEIARVLGITAGDAEPDLTPHPMDAAREAGFDFFIRHDFQAVIDDPGPGDLSACPVPMIPAAGERTPPDVFDARCAAELSKLTGTGLLKFPGGHNGNLSHPRAYAARLRDVLAARPAPIGSTP
ncbi:alpha/beta hydrolase [Actinomadura sp. ATCC 31491]|uniref:Alpha/beta hydrolase n=1 Tax=Actinomadura luzonensis TaxID=2805427 RepID=A0ABT0GC61_9ACTN|nr:alpha/beta hydrolase [Actinomadura luzonensis]MCK2221835.1 alpha/beta hydrolase [Actinomadura luzonensis]